MPATARFLDLLPRKLSVDPPLEPPSRSGASPSAHGMLAVLHDFALYVSRDGISIC